MHSIRIPNVHFMSLVYVFWNHNCSFSSLLLSQTFLIINIIFFSFKTHDQSLDQTFPFTFGLDSSETTQINIYGGTTKCARSCIVNFFFFFFLSWKNICIVASEFQWRDSVIFYAGHLVGWWCVFSNGHIWHMQKKKNKQLLPQLLPPLLRPLLPLLLPLLLPPLLLSKIRHPPRSRSHIHIKMRHKQIAQITQTRRS